MRYFEMGEKIMLRYLVFNDHGVWIAQGLELDICAQGASLEAAARRFEATVREEMKERRADGNAVENIGEAPQRFFAMWNQCDDGKRTLQVA
jgi:hypothetical protein